MSVRSCGLRGCKNRPTPFPGRMSQKGTKPGSVCLSVSIVCVCVCVLLFIRDTFVLMLVCVCMCSVSWLLLVKLSLLGK